METVPCTFAEGLGAVPGAVLGAEQGGSSLHVHAVPRQALKGHRPVEGELAAHSQTIGRDPWVTTVND